MSSLSDLIEEAKAKDRFFKRSMEYRLQERANPKAPDLEWLMPRLEIILGRQYVQDAARSFIETQTRESDGEVSVVKPEEPQTKPTEPEQTQP